MTEMQYWIIKCVGHEALVQHVQQLINDGWRPQGGVAVEGTGAFLQAMVRGDDA